MLNEASANHLTAVETVYTICDATNRLNKPNMHKSDQKGHTKINILRNVCIVYVNFIEVCSSSKKCLRMFAAYNFDFLTSGVYLVELLLISCRYFLNNSLLTVPRR